MKLMAPKKQSAVHCNQQDQRVFNLSNVGRQEWKSGENGPYCFDGLAASVSLRPSGVVFGLMFATTNGKLRCTNSYNKRVVSREQAVEFLELTLDILKDACDEISSS